MRQSYARADDWFIGKFGNDYLNSMSDVYAEKNNGIGFSDMAGQMLFQNIIKDSVDMCRELVASDEIPNEKLWIIMSIYMTNMYENALEQ
ncbi:hypothetical protein [Vibrio sp. SCSIO 43136]|uniref:hypothetical protein n=1 Tax=Vibrio sp. SCSIO 43136 TaxID=2819101 RepID=UPI002074B507|nr:hypothetical protein [Vibrio sp. SCSIO 43136]USD66855.1 hypothetical protein J4N39_19580 [Vibrio sp. SCSIO 43136]